VWRRRKSQLRVAEGFHTCWSLGRAGLLLPLNNLGSYRRQTVNQLSHYSGFRRSVFLTPKFFKYNFSAVLWIRVRMFLDLPDPDPSLFVGIRILSSSGKNSKKNLDFYCFVT
jgi:hypothetical protein